VASWTEFERQRTERWLDFDTDGVVKAIGYTVDRTRQHEYYLAVRLPRWVCAVIAPSGRPRVSGAPIAFTQCIFRDLNPNDHFIGEQPAPKDGVWVYGHIRTGRTTSAKRHILLGIQDLLRDVLKVSDSVVWVYLNELAHNDMVEFGRVLPEPGDEQAWMADLPSELRDHLVSLDGGASEWVVVRLCPAGVKVFSPNTDQ
jgi:phenylpyruvate tautomerase PptA (4-oxalocrotonate tautomerase family)